MDELLKDTRYAIRMLAKQRGYITTLDLSIVNVGQTFYGFGWEMLLLEAGFTVAFLGSDQTDPPRTILILVAWLVFRLEFGAGMIKIRGGREWRDLTALYYHHETQPMPGPFSWYFHRLPRPLHRVEVAANHVTQLVVPFGLFLPQPVAGTCAAIMIITQLWLVISGNFAWLNWLAIVLALEMQFAGDVFQEHAGRDRRQSQQRPAPGGGTRGCGAQRGPLVRGADRRRLDGHLADLGDDLGAGRRLRLPRGRDRSRRLRRPWDRSEPVPRRGRCSG